MRKRKKVNKNEKYFYVLISKSNHVKISSTLENTIQRMRGAGILDHNVAQFKCLVAKDSAKGFVQEFIGGNEFEFETKHRENFSQEVKYFLKHVYKK